MSGRVDAVVVNRIAREAFDVLRDVDPRLNVTDASDLTRLERNGDTSRSKELDEILGVAEVVYALKLPERLLDRAPRLRWIQTISTGVDKILTRELAESRVTVTNMSGIHEMTIAEYVLMVMLMFVKQMPRSFYQQIEGRWKWYPVDVLEGKTVGIVGLGRIGREVARVCKLFNMRVVATHRSAVEGETADRVDTVYPLARLHNLLGETDFVVLALPLTAESAGLVGEPELRAMKPSARIINVARGEIIDEPVLVRALQEGWIAGAGLDVYTDEPLSPDSPLRHMENVVFTPHVAGDLERYDMMAAAFFAQNLRRYLDDEPLLNVVDKTRGY
ncbi:MAG: D-2-hydroxyacid dehydrogenase [Chloroflexota bacterium]